MNIVRRNANNLSSDTLGLTVVQVYAKPLWCLKPLLYTDISARAIHSVPRRNARKNVHVKTPRGAGAACGMDCTRSEASKICEVGSEISMHALVSLNSWSILYLFFCLLKI